MMYRVLLRKKPNRKWQVWIAVVPFRGTPDAVPMLKHAGKPVIDLARLGKKPGPKLPYNTLPTFEWDTKQEAEDVGSLFGRYVLKLGDFVSTWMSVEEG